MSAHDDHSHAPNRYAVLSTAERFGDAPELTGRGVTIAFLDSGFQPHPDLTRPADRILAYHDVHEPSSVLDAARPPRADDWHGTQTCVVAAGSGFLSDGVYRGLASEASLVLVRVARDGKISEDAIASGLEWVIENRERHGIRVVSMSLGGDLDRPLAESRVNQLAERAVADGLVLVAAAGNSGCGERHRCLPPATAPSVIAVGGYDDRNDPERRQIGLYCSSFGETADGLVKPELIAPAMWIAAPILPGTPQYVRAESLARLAATPDNRLAGALAAARDRLGASLAPEMADPEAVRRWIDGSLRSERLVSAHYQQVDGTSFAAPVAASVAALMLEANPQLSPLGVKRILLQTARPVGELPPLRQGYGVLDARAAIASARIEKHADRSATGTRLASGRIEFRFHNDIARSVTVAGSFDGWRPGGTPMRREDSGEWSLSIPAPSPGSYRYKFVVDGTRWLSDPSHARREPDPYGGFDSVLEVP